MHHTWVNGESVQWGAGGLSYEDAATPYRCAACGAKFVHRYHIQPNIYKAMEEAGITEDGCQSNSWIAES